MTGGYLQSNIVNRTLKFVLSQYDCVIPDSGDAEGPLSPNDPYDGEFDTAVNGLYIDAMDAVKLRLGLQIVMLISIRGNNYLQSSALSALVYPFMPATSGAILKQLNAPARTVPVVLSNDILGGHTIGTPEHLFKKIDDGMAEVWKQKFGGNEAAAETADKPPAGVKGKKKGAAKAAAVVDGPKSPEVLELEAKVAEQGQTVRNLKAQTPKTPELEGQIKAAVDVLKRLKGELEAAILQCTKDNKAN